ncbi:FtsW/RodA/SpoVE family cell cycle protein [Aerococcaceae bacterium DSM 111020]|nr:FtsW/RodA/SpoVE family cell cycle protein [Aerococcaceae bacterium DSM 111020]
MKEHHTSSSHIKRLLNGHRRPFSKVEIKSGLDKPLFFVTCALIIIGLIMVFSATTSIGPNGEVTDPVGHFTLQLTAVLLGVVFSWGILHLEEFVFKEYAFILASLLVMLILLLAVHFFGVEAGGAKSWLPIGGATVQPSEFLKIISILTIARLLSDTDRIPLLSEINWRTVPRVKLIIVGILLACFILILAQSDVGMLLIILTTCILMVSLTKWSLRVNLLGLIGALVAVVLMTGLIRLLFGDANPNRHYILNRFIAFVNPYEFQDSLGFQLVQGYQAIANGGLFGRGLGQSLMKHDGRLPAAENDFILAILVEEFGIVGGIAVLGLFFILIFRLIRWSTHSQDSFRSKVFLGIAILFFVQIVVNVGGMLGLIPLSGVTLPFISEGGTSMLMFIMMMAIALRLIIIEKESSTIVQEKEESA